VTHTSEEPAPSKRPHPVLRAYYEREGERQVFVRRLFDETAADYDHIERVMSLGTGSWYRRQALLRAGLEPGMRVLDVAVGTGLVAREALAVVGASGLVVGLDPSAGMLRQARTALPAPLVQGFGERLPFAEGRFDMVTLGYALRHVSDLDRLFREFRRVLRPGGIVCMLEIALPERAMSRSLLKWYIRGLGPLLSRIVARTPQAPTLYRYFWDTIETCVPPARVLEALREAGFGEAKQRVDARIFAEYTARR